MGTLTGVSTQSLATSVAAAVLGGASFGADVCVFATAKAGARREFGLDDAAVERLVAALPAGAVLGSLVGGVLAGDGRRRRAIAVGALTFVAASALMATATGPGALAGGRFLAGVALGCSAAPTAVLLAELAPPSARGAIVGLYELAVCVGCLGVLGANAVLQAYRGDAAWRVMVALAAAPAALQLLLVPALPALSGGGSVDAPAVPPRAPAAIPPDFASGDGGGDAEDAPALPGPPRLGRRSCACSRPRESHGCGRGALGCADLATAARHPARRRALLVAVGAAVAQNAAFSSSWLYYGEDVLQDAGCAAPAAAVARLGAVKLAGVCVALAALRFVPRRPMLLATTAAQVLALLGLAAALRWGAAGAPADGGRQCTLATLALAAFVLAWNAGWAPALFVVVAEVLPADLRAAGGGLALAAFWASSAAASGSLLTLRAALGGPGAAVAAAAGGVAVWWWVLSCLPETHGVALQDIEGALGTAPDAPTAGRANGAGAGVAAAPGATSD